MKLVASLSWWADAIQASTRNVTSAVSLTGAADEAEILSTSKESFDVALGILSQDGFPLSITDAKHLLFRAKSLKKWRFACGIGAKRRDEAYDGFIQRNSLVADAKDAAPVAIRNNMRRLLASWLPDVSRDIIPFGRFGPGACAERLTRLERFRRLHEWIAQSPHWPESPVGVPDAEHVCARLHAVPKDWYRDRLITVEPAYGTFAQQYVRSLLLESVHAGPLRGTAYDQLYVDAPAVQQRRALTGSRLKSLGTLDLKDASDSISWDLVRDVFPQWVVSLLEVTRSENFSDPRTNQVYPLRIFAGMGNATTFCVETLTFGAYVVAQAMYNGLRARCTVFGDDVIADSNLCDLLLRRQEFDPCFIINTQKSFSGNSPLRESCGIFAYNGADITVPKCDGYTDTWQGRAGLADLYWRLDQFPILQHQIASLHVLPNWDRRISGVPSTYDVLMPFDALPPHRWNASYQRREYRVSVPTPILRRIPLADVGPSRGCAAAWLDATLCGMFGADDLQGRFALLPTGKYRDHLRWSPELL